MNGLAQFKKYESYKDSGVEWIGEIPNEWTLVKLVDLADLNIANSFTDGDWIEDEFITDEGIRLIQTGNVGTGFFVDKETKKYISEESFKKLKCKDVITGDILICRLADPTGRSCIVPSNEERMITSVDVVILRSKKSYDTRFLNYYFNSSVNLYVCKLFEQGSTRKRISRKNLGFIKVLNPCYEEQIQIANFLDRETAKFDGLISKKQRLIELLKEKRQVLITHAVTKGLDPNAKMKDSGIEWIGEIPGDWKVLQIKRISRVCRGSSPRPIDDPIYFDDDGEYAWVRISDVSKSNMYLNSTEQMLSVLGSNKSVKMNCGDMFLSIAGTVGKPCIANIKCCIHDGFVYFPDYLDNIKFLYYIFDAGQAYKGLGKMGTQLNLNTDTVGSINIPFPVKEIQDEIVGFIDNETLKIDSLIDKLQIQITKIQEYRQALITAAVTGKIDVRDEVILSQEREGKPLE